MCPTVDDFVKKSEWAGKASTRQVLVNKLQGKSFSLIFAVWLILNFTSPLRTTYRTVLNAI